MYTIKLNNDKALETTVKTTLMQKENGVDKIQFLLPPTYESQDLSEYMITMVWRDPNGNLHTGLLERDLDIYRNYIRCVYIATKEFLSQAGEIEVWLNMMNPALDDDIPYKTLRTFSTVIRVDKPGSYADFADYEALEAMKQKIKDLDDSMPTDLAVDEETDNLHLVHGDEQIGNGVEIMVPGDHDLDDGEHDGIVDLDVITDDDGDVAPAFIELEDEEE